MAAWCGTGQIAELVLSGDKLDGKRESTRPGQWAREQLGFYLGPARFLRDDAGKRWTRVLGDDGFLGSTADLMAAGI
ncbi:hypothetical protein M0R45_026010 [Rubus argutus]|uniref:Uncharacterized protein n=1 Tax=Rubus argutus TaxID=59490 RepID=A0AAW1VQ01_RUBAR